jgi:hypothetical protein
VNTCHSAKVSERGLEVHNVCYIKTVPPTCESDGYEKYSCAICNRSYEVVTELRGCVMISIEKEVIWDDCAEYTADMSKCERCGNIGDLICMSNEDYSQNLNVYVELKDDGTYKIISYHERFSEIFSVPEEILKELNVTEIELKRIDDYMLIRIPDGVKTIKAGSFSFNRSLQTIILPSTITKIEEGAFGDAPMLHTIYFCGTEEQWAAVNLGSYAEKWADAKVIFAPEGVSHETASKSFFTQEDAEAEMESKKAETESIAAALAAAQKEGVTLVDDGIIKNVVVDSEGGTVVVISASVGGAQRVCVYSAEDFALKCEFSLNFEVSICDAHGGKIALASQNNVYVYSADGSLVASFEAEANNIKIADGYVYYTKGNVLYAYSMEAGESERIFAGYNLGMRIYRERHRIVAWTNGVSPAKTYIVDTEKAELICTLDEIYDGDQTYSGYIETYNGNGIYDLDGNLVKKDEMPKPTELVKIGKVKKAMIYRELLCNDKANVLLCFLSDGTACVAVKTGAESKPVMLEYYAESAVLMPDGRVLLYTGGGYGLIAVNVK